MGGLSFAARQSTRSSPMVATAPPSPSSSFPRSFVPAVFDPSDWGQAEPLYRALLGREIGSPGELEKWLRDFSELDSVMDEYESRRYIDKSCHTEDAEIE